MNPIDLILLLSLIVFFAAILNTLSLSRKLKGATEDLHRRKEDASRCASGSSVLSSGSHPVPNGTGGAQWGQSSLSQSPEGPSVDRLRLIELTVGPAGLLCFYGHSRHLDDAVSNYCISFQRLRVPLHFDPGGLQHVVWISTPEKGDEPSWTVCEKYYQVCPGIFSQQIP